MGLFSGVTKVVKKVLHPVTNLVGGSLNDLTGASDTAKQSYNYSLDLANREFENNVKLWNMQNEYNTPTAQIARMKDAGIDINPMTYAVGNGNMSSTASSISTPHYGQPSFSSAGNPISMLMSVVSGIHQIDGVKKDNELKQKMIDNYEADHQPEWLQFANALGMLLTGNTYKNASDIMGNLRNALGIAKKPLVSTPEMEAIIQKNKDWWKGEGQYIHSKDWKKNLLNPSKLDYWSK